MDKKAIPEIRSAYAIYRAKRAEERKYLRRLQKEIKKYYFIDEMQKLRQSYADDNKLEWAVMSLFESIGFKGTKPKSNADVDARVKFKNIQFGIEVKNGDMVGENEMFQAHKYKVRNDEEYHALIVYNNSKTNQNFDLPRKIDAEKNGFTIITTKDLIKGYFKLKNGIIDFDTFVSRLQIPGLVTFSKKDIDKSKNSVTIR